MKKFFTVMAVIIAVAAFSAQGCTTREEQTPVGPQGTPTVDGQGYYTASSAGVTFKWKINGVNLDCKVSAATTGWVSIGFNSGNTMDGSNFIIGYVTGGSTAVIADEFGTGHAHSADTGSGGANDITNAAGTDNGTITEITFTIPMNSGDAHDKVLAQGGSVWLLFGRGPNGSDNLTQQHSAFGSFQTTLY